MHEELVERLVPDELRALFQRVVQPVEVKRPQGGLCESAGATSEPAHWTTVMVKKRRKSFVVCADFHGLIHQRATAATFTK
ncbi:hypothetical protein [Streptomyces sp. NPDC088246]|uniref:hypothetical protein n=1 Tax=Streptomyces sp. NPDC088246 TaxID=3365842 RepID=UPI0037FA3252